MSDFPEIWILDENHRVYTDSKPGSLWGTLIWRECWRKRTIVGETRASWLVQASGNRTVKLSKKGPWFNVAWSEAEIDQRVWVHDHRHKISELVQKLDFDQLKAVAEILGYEPKAPA